MLDQAAIFAFLNAIDDNLVMVQPDGCILFANASARRFLGTAESDPVGTLLFPYFNEYNSAILQDLLARTVQPGTIYSTEIERNEFGSVGIYQIRCCLLPDQVIIMYLVDISMLKNLEIELFETRDLMLQGNRQKSAFLANMSHEFRNPLFTILTSVELMVRENVSPSQIGYLMTIREAANTLLRTLTGILDFSKLDGGESQLKNQHTILPDLLENLLREYAPLAQAKGLEISCDLDANMPEDVVTDPVRLRQVLATLLDNAVKFTEKGEVTLRVRLEEERFNSVTLAFSISDTGIGISPDVQQHLFTVFNQGEVGLARRYGGAGLGLATCHQLARLFDGTLKVESAVGKGSTFTLRLPMALHSRESVNQFLPLEKLRGLRVLVVDDNDTTLDILHDMLKNWGLSCSKAHDAEQALSLWRDASARHAPFHYVLLDGRIPETDSLGLAAEFLRKPSTKVLVMLEQVEEQQRQAEYQALGVYNFVTKPVLQKELLERLSSFLLPGQAALPPSTPPAKRVASLPISDLPAANSSRAERHRVLLVDDDSLNRRLVRELLQKVLECHVIEARNGEEAIQQARDNDYDMVFMDVQMPNMDGIEATRHIRNHEVTIGKHTPIVALTALVENEYREHCLRAGMDDFLTKPVQIGELQLVLTRWGRKVAVGAGVGVEVTRPVLSSGDWDLQIGLELFNGDRETFLAAARLFCEDGMALLDQAAEHLQHHRAPEAAKALHTLRGVVGYFGARRIPQLAVDIEHQLKNGAIELAREAFPELHSQIGQLVAFLQSPELEELLLQG